MASINEFIQKYQAIQKDFEEIIENPDWRAECRKKKINVVSKGKKVNFKYDNRCKLKTAWTRSCRGVCVEFDTETGKPIRKPIYSFNKFDNRHNEPDFYNNLLECEAVVLANKFDGSFVRIWYDGVEEKFVTATLGTLSADDKFLVAETMIDQRIARHLKGNPYDCLLVELITPKNIIVTDYNGKSFLTPLSIVSHIDGLPRWSTLRKVVPDMFMENGLPYYCRFTTIETLENDLKEFEQMTIDNPDVYGRIPEGVCVYQCSLKDGLVDVATPMSKIKRDEYVSVHGKPSGKKEEKSKPPAILGRAVTDPKFLQQHAILKFIYDDIEEKTEDEFFMVLENWYENYKTIDRDTNVKKELFGKKDHDKYGRTFRDLLLEIDNKGRTKLEQFFCRYGPQWYQ
nr:ORF64 [Ostreid herpesvirus 1]